MNSSVRDFTVRLDSDSLRDYLTAYRTALTLFPAPSLNDFLPSATHPRFLEILSELIRLDLVHGWKAGRPTSLEEYQERFPELRTRPVLLYKIACEEFLLRRQAGENPTMAEYRQRISVDQDDWPTTRVKSLDPETSSKLDIALASSDGTRRSEEAPDRDDSLCQTRPGIFTGKQEGPNHGSRPNPGELDFLDGTAEMPAVGDQFLDFSLLAELGRGAFGRVFLAQQGHLAGRLVALKIGMGLFTESQALAQLQHTHIVPIYSYHHGEPYQAVCMPYLGSTTLAQVLADLRSQQSWPSSGQDLLTTLKSRKKNDNAPPINEGPASNPKESVVEARPVPAQFPQPDHLIGLAQLSYVDSILSLAVNLADGLAHAHERGIIHRDLKPANVLITDDGQPMLLDFNLAHDTKLREHSCDASMGGTLPYMAPEHLAALHGRPETVDARSDVYSLGVILFELLTGNSPFPTYKRVPPREIVETMIRDRANGPPPMRTLNSSISPAVEAIIRRCLQAAPSKRYQTARQFKEDLACHLENRPLRHAGNPSWFEVASKFRKRHPKMTSLASLATVAAGIIFTLMALLAANEKERHRLAARQTLSRFLDGSLATHFLLNSSTSREHLAMGEQTCRETLDHFRVLENPVWQNEPAVRSLSAAEQSQLNEEAGQLLLLLAHVRQTAGDQERNPSRQTAMFQEALHYCSLAERCFNEGKAPRALWKQQGELHRRMNEHQLAEACFERAKSSDLRNAYDRYLEARQLAKGGRFREALPILRDAVRSNPQDYQVHFLKGICHDYLAQHSDAASEYSVCIALRPTFFGAYYNRGLSLLRQNEFKLALADFDEVERLQPDHSELYVQRSIARQGVGKPAEAISDLTTALDRGFAQTRVFFMRAKLREKTGDAAGAKADLAEGLRRDPTDERSWVARGIAFLPGDPQRALADFDKAIEINPRSLAALQNKAHVLGKYLKKTEEAVQTLDAAIALYPDDARPRAGRGVYLARLGKRDAALEDATQALLLDTNPPNLYQVAGIYALTSKTDPEDQREALRLLAAALKKGFGHEYLEADRDLDPLRDVPAFRRLVEASRAIRLTPARPRL